MKQEANYKDTLNLPRTDFPMRADLPKREPQALERWARDDIYGLIRKRYKGAAKYILHDGPPYSNGDIHIGHSLNKILKDIIIKYKSMRGFDAPYVPGWDCHGLPVEHALFKDLKITRHEISQVAFRKKAYEYARRFVDIQRTQFRRLGVFGDWDAPYLTLDYKYEADIIGSFGRLADAGYIYKGRKPVNWCVECETALAEAEVEYEDKSSPSIYVKFKLVQSPKSKVQSNGETYFIIWTTTPWTLVSNVAIAVHPDLEYAVVKVEGKQIWILASNLLQNCMAKFAIKDYEILKAVSGRELEGRQCEHPFIDRKAKVVLADFISKDEGSGVVHIAPGHGEEDYKVGQRYKLDILMPVGNDGRFDDTAGELKGVHIFKANEQIIERLKGLGRLVCREDIAHSYPHCWRCKKPIAFRATAQWFIDIDHDGLRGRSENAVREVVWVPEIGQKRIGAMVKTRPDWCLSRQRYWGVPIPAAYCENCDEAILNRDLIEALRRDVEKDGADVWFIKDIKEFMPEDFVCPKCKKSDFRKEMDIMDVWFDSGVSHQAVLARRPELRFPADLYLEGSDQHRGWFQSALLTSMAITGEPPFKSVLTHGFVVDGEGRKMSKSTGNVISPQDIIKEHGADILRLWVSSCDYSSDVRISGTILEQTKEAYRKIRNTLKFIIGNLYDYNPEKEVVEYNNLPAIDRWALSRSHSLLRDIGQFYETYQFHRVYRSLYNFCSEELSAIYLDILKDRLYTFGARSSERKAAQTALYEIFNILVKSMAPVLPFTAEEAWGYIKDYEGIQSVHLAGWHEERPSYIDEALEREWAGILNLRAVVMEELERLREKKVLGSPQEAKVILHYENNSAPRAMRRYAPSLASYFIVSQVEIKEEDLLLDYKSHSYYNDTLQEEACRVQVKVEKAGGRKCPRCWNYTEDVGASAEYPGICARCARALQT